METAETTVGRIYMYIIYILLVYTGGTAVGVRSDVGTTIGGSV